MTTGDGTTPAADGVVGQRATVLAKLVNGMFRLRTTDGREVAAHAAKDLRMAFARLLPGDQVIVEVSPFDPHKARICRLLESSQPSQQSTQPSIPPQQRELS
jgi:translation initiation factor IF-1